MGDYDLSTGCYMGVSAFCTSVSSFKVHLSRRDGSVSKVLGMLT